MLCHPIDPHIISDSPCSPTVYWINKLSLTPDDHDILQEGRQLNDKIIAGVGMILESQFPELPHFQLTLYSQAVENLHPAEEGSLFFHNFSNHWAVSHLTQSSSVRQFAAKENCTRTAKAAGSSLRPSWRWKELRVCIPPVQLQKGTTDCGCFAVAFAVSLLFGDDPTSLLYHQKEMRRHLQECFLADLFSPFPASDKKAKRKPKTIELTVSVWNYLIYMYKLWFTVHFLVFSMKNFGVVNEVGWISTI